MQLGMSLWSYKASMKLVPEGEDESGSCGRKGAAVVYILFLFGFAIAFVIIIAIS
jgi:uncharacterized membrane protein